MLITMNVNGKKVDIDVSYDEYLVDTLRRIGNLSVKRGCDTGCCGLCSIWIDEKPTLSCSTLSIRRNNTLLNWKSMQMYRLYGTT